MSKNFINSLSSKAAFKVGLLSGLAVTFVIGFFILLGLVFDKDDKLVEVLYLSGEAPRLECVKKSFLKNLQ